MCRVSYKDPEKGRFYQFLTNSYTLAASTIALIYKDRWCVEVFFKAIEWNLKIKHFVGRSKNAILRQGRQDSAENYGGATSDYFEYLR
jgi:putative transposase